MEKIKKVEVLITTMNMDNPNYLLNKMNIQGNAIIGNQTTYNKVHTFSNGIQNILIYSFNERGVGLNRNNLLMRSKGDYCLFGDDDLIYVDEYEKIILEEFEKHKDADIIIFNLDENESKRYKIKKCFKVNYFNFMRFGAARLAINRNKILLNGILFNICFGGGTSHSNGEDTLFIAECLKKGLKIYAVPKTIATLCDDRESTWFKGYDNKYFEDKGLLYYIISKKFYKFLCLQDLIRHKKLYKYNSIKENYKLMMNGILKAKQGE